MSFITKRERVFNEYDLFELPSRNEGKLKAYASCTDARAWSHFCSDKAEHLVEIIKRNNETCRPKYVPTNVIVDTLMVAKNTEISRLKRKIEEFEQMLAAYDQLDLTYDQKCEIANAHAAIKTANKELDELCLDLDLSGFTEGVDSEAFETGKSRGDEPGKLRGNETEKSKTDEAGLSRGDDWSYDKKPTPKMETKSNQMGVTCPCDVSTSAYDPRIEEMRETIISKDAKLNAMQNTIAVMENDVCEPYCIYAHIYTAIEKIFGILCQNAKYKQYLDLLTAGKDTRCIDIKGKILFKLKVLEKFCVALIAPCSQNFNTTPQGCSCFRAEIVARVETAFALTSAESEKPSLDNKRALLVADIMENEEMKEILSKESASINIDDNQTDECFCVDAYSIDTENLNRLKNLQANYDDLMTCYENLKHEKDCLQVKCYKYEELEKELENLRNQLREYNLMWNEKEHYRKRSEDIDSLKEKYLVLSEETSNLETQLKAESEINSMKTNTIDELRNENITLENKLNQVSIVFEKEKNTLQCKLKETECKVMCQEQQIKSLSTQIDKLLEQDRDKTQIGEDAPVTIVLIDEIESLKEQRKNLKDALICNEEEKQHLQNEFQDKLEIINKLKMEIEDWKSTYEKSLQRNDYLENRLIEENRTLSQEVESKNTAIENLLSMVNNKSQEMNILVDEIEQKKSENKSLLTELQDIREIYDKTVTSLQNDNKQVIESLQIARKESQELLEKVKDYDDIIHRQSDISKSIEAEAQSYKEIKNTLLEENKNLQTELANRDNENSILRQELQRLREINNYAVNNITNLQDENSHYKKSLEITKKESKTLERKLSQYENLSHQLKNLRDSQENLIEEKSKLENELRNKANELENAIQSINLSKKESEELIEKINQSENLKDDLIQLKITYQKLAYENNNLQEDIAAKNQDFNSLLQSFDNLKIENEQLKQKSTHSATLEQELSELKKAYEEIIAEKNLLQNDFDNKTEEIGNLYDTLEKKIEENRDLFDQIKSFQSIAKNSIAALQNENLTTQSALNAVRKESIGLIDKLKHYETLENEYDKLKNAHDQMKEEKERLQNELNVQLADLKRIEKENYDLNSHSQNLLTYNKGIETALIEARNELITKTESRVDSYADIIIEIEDMRKEKLCNQKKIRDLLDDIDKSESKISNLVEEVMARDCTIAKLENHINELEDEIRRLHDNLSLVIDTGEEITENTYHKIDQSLKRMEAHHSKATHNMKMELAKLQNKNVKLEEQLSITRLKSEEMSRDKYISQINYLQSEREIIVTDIKQLEIKTVGDSLLSPDKCNIEEILTTLDRIGKCFESKCSRNTLLEQTLSLKVQSHSQLLLSKVDEAKKIVEKEKEKIINEKEDAIKDRLNMEKQLNDLKEKLDKQISQDKNVIKDLEAEILNQKLIIDKINKSTQNYISKLEDEMQSLQDLYQNSMAKVSELQEKLHNMSEENNKYLNLIERTNLELEEKSKEIAILQKKIEELKKKSNRNFGVQAWLSDNYRSVSLQIDQNLYEKPKNIIELNEVSKSDVKSTEKISDATNVMKIKATQNYKDKQISDLLPKQKPHSINEVQILTANVEPTFDFVKSTYLNYKLKRLSPGRMEQYSISCSNDNKDSNCEETPIIESDNLFSQSPVALSERSTKIYSQSMFQDPHLIDIFNRQSMHSISSNIESPKFSKQEHESTAKLLPFTEYELVNNSFEATSNVNNCNYKDESTSEKSTDKDIFVIYKDKDNDYEKKPHKDYWPGNGRTEILAEAVIIQTTQNLKTSNQIINTTRHQHIRQKTDEKYHKEEDLFFDQEEEENEDDSVKPKLDIDLPRVSTDSPSITTTSDGDKKSLDSYTLAIYPSPKRIFSDETNIRSHDYKQDASSIPIYPLNNESQYLQSHSSLEMPLEKDIKKYVSQKRMKFIDRDDNHDIKTSNMQKQEQEKPINTKLKQLDDKDSHHKLSRVGANVLLIKTDTKQKDADNKIASKKQDNRNFGLKYILDTVQHEIDPDNVKTCNMLQELRKTKSDERFNQLYDKMNNSPSKLSPIKVSSLEYKTVSSESPSKLSENSRQKSFVERSIMVKTDAIADYENKIEYLTKTLENTEKDYKKKIEAIKVQYDCNIRSIINEHNQGVKSIQSLHEEALQDIIKVHENEVENLRTMSIEALRKVEKLEKENKTLKNKIQHYSSNLDEEPIKITTFDVTKRKIKLRSEKKMLTKTTIEAFNVKPKLRIHGPCTCSLDVNISDTIRNIFEQVDVDQRKMAEHAYLKYIANKILNSNIEALDGQELSFLHLKVCRTWKMKISKEEALQKRIDSLENELMNKQRHAQQHIAELDRKVAEERRRLQEVREAVCRSTPVDSRGASPDLESRLVPPRPHPTAAEKDFTCNCNPGPFKIEVNERKSADDLPSGITSTGVRTKRRAESNRAVLAKLDIEERREKKLNDELPTRLRRTHERPGLRSHFKK